MSTQLNTIETNGWDTIYAVPFSEVNRAILNKSTSPTSFSESETSNMVSTSFSGTFSHWELNKGGDGRLVMLKLPMPTAAFSTGQNTQNFTNGYAIIQANLAWVADANNPYYQNLILNNNATTVQVIDIVFDGLTPASKGVMIQFLHNWLVKNNSSFTNVFASININVAADTASFAWLKPTSYSYAVKDVDDTNSVFAILCMTENRVAPGSTQVPVNALSATANSALLISPERVIAKMFYPNINGMFKNAALSSFEIGNTDLYIVNKEDLTFVDQSMPNGSSKTLSIKSDNFRLEIQDSRVIMTLNKVGFNYSSGVGVNFNHVSVATFDIKADGKFNLVIKSSNTDIGVETSTGVLVGEIVGGIAAAVVGAIIGGILGGALAGGEEAAANVAVELAENGVAEGIEMQAQGGAQVAADVVAEVAANAPARFATFFAQNWTKLFGGFVGIVIGEGTVQGTLAGVEYLAKGKTPDLLKFGSDAIKPVAWPSTTNNEFTIKDGQLNGALQLGINLKTN
jgi:hypothetical protein